ncbi:hypothetical protein NDU88_005667, partial [Pleurodeles waltl]
CISLSLCPTPLALMAHNTHSASVFVPHSPCTDGSQDVDCIAFFVAHSHVQMAHKTQCISLSSCPTTLVLIAHKT